MSIHQQIGHAPMPAVAAILSRYDREQLAAFVTVAIDLMDVVDGDPDNEVEDPAGETIPVIDDPVLPPEEDEGDPDLEEVGAEDSFMSFDRNGPGCAISDAGGGAVDDEGEPDDDDKGDVSWTEWHTRGRHKQDEFGSESRTRIGHCQTALEDDEDDDPGEDDDPAGQRDEDGINTGGTPTFGWGGPQGAGCPISDPGEEIGDTELNGDEGDYSAGLPYWEG